MPLIVLIGTGIAMSFETPRASMLNSGPHGLSEVLYAFTSAANNNGSAFAGISVNTPFYNIALGFAMLLGRFLPIIFVLALAGSLAAPAAGAEDGGHAAHARPAVRRDAHRRGDHRRRPDLLPRPRSRSSRGRPLMTTLTHAPPSRGAQARRGRVARPQDAAHLAAGRAAQARPEGHDAQPGHVRRRGRRRALDRVRRSPTPSVFAWAVVAWLWLTVVFANLAEAVAEGRGKAQAATLRRAKTETTAHLHRTGPRTSRRRS